MANSTISTNNKVINFQKAVFKEYVSTGEFEKFTGTSSDAIIQINRDLQKHSIPLIAKLNGSGVRGSGVLNGNEESLANYEMRFEPTYHRNAVTITNEENEKLSDRIPKLLRLSSTIKLDLLFDIASYFCHSIPLEEVPGTPVLAKLVQNCIMFFEVNFFDGPLG